MTLTKLRLSGVTFPPRSDTDISATLRLIDAASDIRRTVNGDAVNVARSAFRKYAVSLSGSDMHFPGISHLNPGDYVEFVPFERVAYSFQFETSLPTVPRAGFEFVGIAPDGSKLSGPEALAVDMAELETLSQEFSSLRVSLLRTPVSPFFSQPVRALRYRPLLCCMVVSSSFTSDERTASDSWSLELEEV